MPDQSVAKAKAINRSPLFDSPDGWSSGFALAKDPGPGVVVGPGSANPNVFVQHIPVRPKQQFEVIARAASVDKPEATALVQIAWHDGSGQYIAVSMHHFKVTSAERTVRHDVLAPGRAEYGAVYVVPGGPRETVRYTEMTVRRLDPLADFWQYKFFGITGLNLLLLGAAIAALTAIYFTKKKEFHRAGSFVLKLTPRVFPLLALLSCAAVFIFLGAIYELNYDAQWHQGSIDSIMEWNTVSPDIGGNPLHNFGIQQVINPQLSPTFWLGSIVPADVRIQVQGAFQAVALFLLMVWACRIAGARLADASAISLVAVYYCCVPNLTNGAIPEDAILGLLWQEGAIATLIAYLCFSLVGYAKDVSPLVPGAAFIATVLWFFLAYPELVTFFVIATSGLCAGSMVAVESRRELLYKSGAALALIAILLALGVQSYVLNLFMYTPQMYYTRVFVPDFVWMFTTSTSLLFRWVPLGLRAAPLLAFFGLAALGAFFSLRYGSRFARRLVFGALALEIFIVGCGVLNMVGRIAPLNLFYAEIMGLTVAALLAGTGVWGLLLSVAKAVAERVEPLLTKSPMAVASDAYRSYSFLILLLMVGYLFYLLSGPGSFVSAWPPATDSVTAQIQAKELAIRPGDGFKGRAIVLLATQKNAPSHWVDVFNIVVYKMRAVLGNDLMNDAKIAGIPVANEYGHWLSPPMLALLSVGFYRPEDHIGRAAQTPRAFRPNLARLMGISLAVTDGELSGEEEIYRGSVLDHPLYMYRIVGANLGDFSPTKTVHSTDAAQIVDHLRAPGFDGRKLAVAEDELPDNLVAVGSVEVSLHKGPRIHVEAQSAGTSLLVLPFEFSYCLQVRGTGLDRMIPVNLAQTGLVIHGSASLDLVYRYGLLSGTSCRKKDRQRIDRLGLAEFAPGRLFYSPRTSVEK